MPVVLFVPLKKHPVFDGTSAECPQVQDANRYLRCCRQIPAAWRWAGISKAFPRFVFQHRAAALLCIFAGSRIIEGPPSDLHGTPKQPESVSSTVKVTRFPPFHSENWKNCIVLPPAPSAPCYGAEGEGQGVICARRWPGSHYIFFETPVKTGINTWLLELQFGSCPLLTAVWRLQCKHLEIRDRNNIAIESQENFVVRFNRHRSVSTGRWLEGPGEGEMERLVSKPCVVGFIEIDKIF